MNIISVRETESVENNVGKQWKRIKFCGIPVFEKVSTTTNKGIINQLASIKPVQDATPSNGKPKMGF